MTAESVGAFVFIKYGFAIPRRDAPESCMKSSAPLRAWGMPGARCTRGLVCTLYW